MNNNEHNLECEKEKLIEFLVEKHDFSKERVEKTINNFVFEKEEKEKQKGLNEWF